MSRLSRLGGRKQLREVLVRIEPVVRDARREERESPLVVVREARTEEEEESPPPPPPPPPVVRDARKEKEDPGVPPVVRRRPSRHDAEWSRLARPNPPTPKSSRLSSLALYKSMGRVGSNSIVCNGIITDDDDDDDGSSSDKSDKESNARSVLWLLRLLLLLLLWLLLLLLVSLWCMDEGSPFNSSFSSSSSRLVSTFVAVPR